MIQLSKTLFKITSSAEFTAETVVAKEILTLAAARADKDTIQWTFESAFIDQKTDKVSAIFINAAAPKQDEFNLTYSAKASNDWQVVEFCSLDQC